MRLEVRTPTPIAVFLTIALASLGCENSNSVTGASPGASAAATVTGMWSGTYSSDDSAGCGGSSATATFRQEGATVTGNLSTSACGVTGVFKGTVQGHILLGAVAMEGCVGGGVSGTISASEISLSIGDLTKPLVTGEKPVMYGGVLTLRR